MSLPTSGFLNRPTYMPKDRFDQEKKILGQRIQALIAQGESITRMMEVPPFPRFHLERQNRRRRLAEKRRLKESKKAAEEYRNACKELDTDYLTLRAQHLNYKDNNPLLPVFSLLLGILAVIASLLWLLQLALYVFPRQLAGYAVAPFLNSLFSRLARLFPILAAALVGAFHRCDVAAGAGAVLHVLHDAGSLQLRSEAVTTGRASHGAT